MSDFLGSDADRRIQLSLYSSNEEGSGTPDDQLHTHWSCPKTNTNDGNRLRDHELLSDRLEMALCETLQDVLSSGDEAYVTEWGDEYDRLMSIR